MALWGTYLEGSVHSLFGGLDTSNVVLRRLDGPTVDAQREGARREGAGGEEDGLAETHCEAVSLTGASGSSESKKEEKGIKQKLYKM